MNCPSRLQVNPPRELASLTRQPQRQLPLTIRRGQYNPRDLTTYCKQQTSSQSQSTPFTLFRQANNAVLSIALSATLCLSQVAPAVAQNPVQEEPNTTTIRFAASANPEIFTTQKTLVEAWAIVQDEFVDDNLNNADWKSELINTMTNIIRSPNRKEAFGFIGDMLEKLGDPYTRIVSPEDYADFRVSSDGELQGVGLMIATDISSGKLVVLSPIKGSPADRAGVQRGDEVVSIDGESTVGWDVERVAKTLRGVGGTSVRVTFARRTDQIPGVPGRPEEPPKLSFQEFNLKREKVVLSSVASTVVPYEGHNIGYLKLSNFTGNSADDLKGAIDDCEKSGADSYVLDLRNNPGGLVKSSMEISRMLMDGHPTIFNVKTRDGYPAQSVSLPNGNSLLKDKLVVLVNENSASASEILAGALQDNGRATIVGDNNTFGKGKIQSVFELADGSALFVTVAKYVTPKQHEIDTVGVHPDSACRTSGLDFEESLEMMGQKITNSSDFSMSSLLQLDDCFVTAESMIAESSAS
eukprot:TRINITY_DN207_c0_g1_i1.p1 TRINITY_DN207_c0_g1~~TRINITY_DN207_c0_g1_i1.p1  ORF type:complete len:551 (-),score=61.69 TRINITY_DN207_c0_g1_i1:469-2043(-)